MSTFAIPVTLINPDDRERSLTVNLLVDTGAFYTMLPPEVVAPLGLTASDLKTVEFANSERAVIGMGEVRVRFNGTEHTTLFLSGPAGCHAVLGAFTLEGFGLAVEPRHQRLVPIPFFTA